MEPKEKAQSLVNQYKLILMDEDTDCGNEALCTSIAIKNALVAVDEVIQSFNDVMIPNPFNQYWQKVKQEIENL
jgi:hypothetical protein